MTQPQDIGQTEVSSDAEGGTVSGAARKSLRRGGRWWECGKGTAIV